jgi:hypothetical protein
MDELKGGLVVAAMVAVPLLTIGVVAAIGDRDTATPPPRPPAAVVPLPAPTTPPTPTPPPVRPAPPGSLAACNRLPTYAERERCRIEEATRYGQRFRGMQPPPAPPIPSPLPSPLPSPRPLQPAPSLPSLPSLPRPIPPYPALPGDPNDRDHDGRACEFGCIN